MTKELKQMRRISIIWGSILVLIVIGLTVLGFTYKHKSSKYKELEETLKLKTEQYVDKKFLYPEESSFLKVTLEELASEDILGSLETEDEKCDGYVIVKKANGIYKYSPYIKCNKYTTKDYDKNK